MAVYFDVLVFFVLKFSDLGPLMCDLGPESLMFSSF